MPKKSPNAVPIATTLIFFILIGSTGGMLGKLIITVSKVILDKSILDNCFIVEINSTVFLVYWLETPRRSRIPLAVDRPPPVYGFKIPKQF